MNFTIDHAAELEVEASGDQFDEGVGEREREA